MVLGEEAKGFSALRNASVALVTSGVGCTANNAKLATNRSTPVNGQTTFDLPSGSMVYSNNTRLFHLNQLEPVKVTVRLWIEGNDPECDDDVQDAQLSVQLGFVGCDKDNKPIS